MTQITPGPLHAYYYLATLTTFYIPGTCISKQSLKPILLPYYPLLKIKETLS